MGVGLLDPGASRPPPTPASPVGPRAPSSRGARVPRPRREGKMEREVGGKF